MISLVLFFRKPGVTVAIGGTLYRHNKYLVARSGLFITILNIVVAIGGTLCCRTKSLVAIGCIAMLFLCCYSIYCHAK
jgi:hypothetical protein